MALLYGNYMGTTGAASPSCGETLGKVAVVLGLFFLKTCGASPLSAVRSGVKAAASQAHEQTRSRAA